MKLRLSVKALILTIILVPASAFAQYQHITPEIGPGPDYEVNFDTGGGDCQNHTPFSVVTYYGEPFTGTALHSFQASPLVNQGSCEAYSGLRASSQNAGGLTGTYYLTASSTVDGQGAVYFSWYYDGYSDTVDSFDTLDTQILTTTPSNNQTVATSTSHTLGYTGFITDEDFGTKTQVLFNVKNGSCQFVSLATCGALEGLHIGIPGNPNAIYFNNVQDISEAGTFEYSTTTYTGLPIGKYYVTITIRKGSYCVFGYCPFVENLVSTSTTFTVSTTTKADKIYDEGVAYKNSLLAGGGSFEHCTFSDFDLFLCGSDFVTWSFVPTPDALDFTYNNLNNSILTKPPFGYVTRIVRILNSTTTVALPDTTFPILMGTGIAGQMSVGTTSLFQADEMVEGAGEVLESIKDPLSGKNVREVTEPIVSIIIWLVAWLTIIMDILGSHKHRSQL